MKTDLASRPDNTAAPEPRRDPSLDIAKGIGIILVVAGHAIRGIDLPPTSLEIVDFAIYTTHMPLFFFIAGFFALATVQRKGFSDYARTNVLNILVLYFSWSVLFWCSKWFLGYFTTINTPVAVSDLVKIPYQPISIYWFLQTLVILQLLLGALRRWLDYLFYASLLAFAAAGLSPVGSLPALVTNSALFAIFYFSGAMLRDRGVKMPGRFNPGAPLIALLAGAFIVLVFEARVLGLSSPVSPFTLPISVIGILSNIAISVSLARSALVPTAIGRHLAWLGEHSLQIYLLHIFAMPFVPRLLAIAGITSGSLEIVAATLIGVYGSMVAFVAMRRIGLAFLFDVSLLPDWQFVARRIRLAVNARNGRP